MYQSHPLDARLAEALAPGRLFAVGGRVRDELRGELEGADGPAKDLDYVVTGLTLDELTARLQTLGRVDLVGAAFAVAKLTTGGLTVDLALPRRERSTGHGHRDFEVQSGPDIPLEDDLARRDFRMNMIARALPGGELVDPYGGEPDIRARRIDILTPVAFDEDPLRMLRAAQFAARFGYEPTPATSEAMRAAAPLVRTVAPERIHDELQKLFALAPKPSVGLRLLEETGVLVQFWPELLEGVGVEQNEWHAYDVWQHNLATLDAIPPGDATLRLAALLHDIGKPRTKEGPHFYRHEQVGAEMAVAMLHRMRFSNETVDTIEHLIRQHMYVQDPELSDAAIRRFIRRIGLEHLQRQFAVRHADIVGSGLPKRDDTNERFEARVWEEVERKPAFSVADLAISGSDVIAAMVRHGLAPSEFRGDARVGAALHWLFEQVTERPERNEREVLLTLLDGYLAVLDRAIG
jgi:putative nucleotidyltransferase with HDIG domain